VRDRLSSLIDKKNMHAHTVTSCLMWCRIMACHVLLVCVHAKRWNVSKRWHVKKSAWSMICDIILHVLLPGRGHNPIHLYLSQIVACHLFPLPLILCFPPSPCRAAVSASGTRLRVCLHLAQPHNMTKEGGDRDCQIPRPLPMTARQPRRQPPSGPCPSCCRRRVGAQITK